MDQLESRMGRLEHEAERPSEAQRRADACARSLVAGHNACHGCDLQHVCNYHDMFRARWSQQAQDNVDLLVEAALATIQVVADVDATEKDVAMVLAELAMIAQEVKKAREETN